jgi:hypothetical protein
MATIRRVGSPLQVAVGSAAAALLVLLTATVAYIVRVEPTLIGYSTLLYPAVWIAVSLGVAVWIGRTVRPRPRRLLGLAIGGGYTLAVCWLTGLVGPSAGTGGIQLIPALPGWGPLLRYDTGLVQLTVIPFKLVAYLALGYVVYVLAASRAGSLRPAVLGLASCVSCTAPLVLALGSVAGGVQASLLVAGAGYEIATAVLVATFGLLALAASRQPGPQQESHNRRAKGDERR